MLGHLKMAQNFKSHTLNSQIVIVLVCWLHVWAPFFPSGASLYNRSLLLSGQEIGPKKSCHGWPLRGISDLKRVGFFGSQLVS